MLVIVAVGENFVTLADSRVSVHSPEHEMVPPSYVFSGAVSASVHDTVHVGANRAVAMFDG